MYGGVPSRMDPVRSDKTEIFRHSHQDIRLNGRAVSSKSLRGDDVTAQVESIFQRLESAPAVSRIVDYARAPGTKGQQRISRAVRKLVVPFDYKLKDVRERAEPDFTKAFPPAPAPAPASAENLSRMHNLQRDAAVQDAQERLDAAISAADNNPTPLVLAGVDAAAKAMAAIRVDPSVLVPIISDRIEPAKESPILVEAGLTASRPPMTFTDIYCVVCDREELPFQNTGRQESWMELALTRDAAFHTMVRMSGFTEDSLEDKGIDFMNPDLDLLVQTLDRITADVWSYLPYETAIERRLLNFLQ